MICVGLLGGIASGKSLVASRLAELGAEVLDADRAGHEALRMPEVVEAVRRQWGEAVFGPDGQVDRGKLSQLVFGDSAEAADRLRQLEAIVHPVIKQIFIEKIRSLENEGKNIIVLDAPLLLEARWDILCDILLFVDVPRPIRFIRAKERGWSEKEFRTREAAQLSVDEKRRRADFIIDNSGSVDSVQPLIERFWHDILHVEK